MSKHDVGLYFEDILQAMEKIEKFMAGMPLEQFRKDIKTQDAVVRNFARELTTFFFRLNLL